MLIGIDFGTSNSAVVEYDPDRGHTEVCRTADGRDILPSAIYIDGQGARYYGATAYKPANHDRKNGALWFKSELGTKWVQTFEASGERLNARECCSEIFRMLIEQAHQNSHGREISGAIVTVPVTHSSLKRDETQKAAEEAGLAKAYLFEEPFAAAVEAATATDFVKNETILVYDLGGGTFDFTLMRVNPENKFDILAHGGEKDCGGRSFDDLILNNCVRPWMLDNFDLPKSFLGQEKTYGHLASCARLAAEDAKITLSVREQTEVRVPHSEIRATDKSGADIFLRAPITQVEYGKWIEPQIAKTVEMMKREIEKENMKLDAIDHIVFVGGPTKNRRVREVVLSEMPRCSPVRVDSMTVVARGAARKCEAFNWGGTGVVAITPRAREVGVGDIEYVYLNRTAEEFAKISMRHRASTTKTVEIRTSEGWMSGRRKLTKELVIGNVPLELGKNLIEISVIHPDGTEETSEIEIYREASSPAFIPQTATLAVEVRHSDWKYLCNRLDPLSQRGERLPTRGESTYMVARDIRSAGDALAIKFYQQPVDENNTAGEPNIYLGFIEFHPRQAEQLGIRAGSRIKISWEISERHEVRIEIDVDGVSREVDTDFVLKDESFYDGEPGRQKVNAMLAGCQEEITEAQLLATSQEERDLLRDLKKSIRDLKADLRNMPRSSSHLRRLVRLTRDMRQEVFRFKHTDEKMAEYLRRETRNVSDVFDRCYRDGAASAVADQFDVLAETVARLLDNPDKEKIAQARNVLGEMETIRRRAYWAQPENIERNFLTIATSSAAIDRDKFQADVEKGKALLDKGRFGELKILYFEMRKNLKRSLSDVERSA